MNLSTIKRFSSWNNKNFFANFWKQFRKILYDIFTVYKNFLHWNLSKICINIWWFLVGVILALPFFLLIVFIALIDPIPWGNFLVYHMQWISPLWEVLEYAGRYTFSFVIVTCLMIITWVMFFIWNAYSHVLYIRLYNSYIDKDKLPLPIRDNIYFSIVHIHRFVTIALWTFLVLLIPTIIILLFVWILIVFFNEGFIDLTIFSLYLFILTLISIFIFSYVIYRIFFAYILMSLDSGKRVAETTARSYIQKSFLITAWWKKYLKFLFILCVAFLVLYPFTMIHNTLDNDTTRLQQTIQYRTLAIADPDKAQESDLRYVAQDYMHLDDETLFANYRGVRLLTFMLSFVSFFILSWLYTMVFFSFYRRVLN